MRHMHCYIDYKLYREINFIEKMFVKVYIIKIYIIFNKNINKNFDKILININKIK